MKPSVSTPCLLLISLFLCMLPAVGQGNGKQADLGRPVTEMKVTSANIFSVLGQLAGDYQLPVGIEMAVTATKPPNPPRQPVIVSHGTLAQVLQAVVTVAPEYYWRDVQGVINIAPYLAQEPVLDIMIDDFEVAQQTTEQVVEHILQSPQVTTKLKEWHLERERTTAWPIGSTAEPELISFHLQKVTVRDILNHLIRQTGNKYWSVRRVEPCDKYFEINIW